MELVFQFTILSHLTEETFWEKKKTILSHWKHWEQKFQKQKQKEQEQETINLLHLQDLFRHHFFN